jgi:hypothetical protein
MSFLTELAGELDKAQQSVPEELWPQAQPPQFPQVVLRIAEEIGDDVLLGEAALNWIKRKKREAMLAAMGVYYTPEELEAMRQRAAEDAAA